MAPATDAMSAVIVAHGSPSDPWPQEQAVRDLARRVARRLPGWRIRGATLAADGTLASALQEVRAGRPLVYPFFMGEGWFVKDQLPVIVRGILGMPARMVCPMGADPAVHALCVDVLRAAAGVSNMDTTVLLAAHGSRSDSRSGAAVRQAAHRISQTGLFRAVRVGFIDGSPDLAEAASVEGPALCLPFFAARAGHVKTDVPQALATASFPGPQLDPVGALPQVPDLIAKALSAHAARLAA